MKITADRVVWLALGALAMSLLATPARGAAWLEGDCGIVLAPDYGGTTVTIDGDGYHDTFLASPELMIGELPAGEYVATWDDGTEDWFYIEACPPPGTTPEPEPTDDPGPPPTPDPSEGPDAWPLVRMFERAVS
jgi:hypothetical protein